MDLGISLRLSSFLSELPALMFPFIDAFAISSVHPGQWNRHARWFVARKRNVQRSQRSSPGVVLKVYTVYSTIQTTEKYSAPMYSGQFCRLRFYQGFIKSGLVTGQARQKETKTEIGGG